MASNRLTKIKRAFYLYQVFVLMVALAGFFFLIVNGYMTNTRLEIQKDLSEVSRVIVNYVKNGQDIPAFTKEFHVYFILDSQSGDYVAERKDASESGGQLWEGFRTKLTYQMQKQKNGQIIYPPKEPKEIFKSTKIVQYTTLPEFNWIVVNEMHWPSEWELLTDITSKNDLVNLLVSIFVGLVILYFFTSNYFIRLEGQISETHEYSFGNFNQNISKSFLSKKGFKKSKIQVDEDGGSQEAEPKPKMVFSEKALGSGLGSKPVSLPSSKMTQTVAPVTQPKRNPISTSAPASKSAEVTERPRENVSGDAHLSRKQTHTSPTVNIEEIKSPVLKKLLEEMREQKRTR